MRKIICVALLLCAPTLAVAQEKWPIRNDTVTPSSSLERLLQNRFGLVESDIEAAQSAMGKGTGTYYYVDSAKGSSTYTGLDWTHPMATIQQAVDLCTASNGDVVWVAQGHTENITSATALKIATAGVRVMGLGKGSNRPTLTCTTATAAVVWINAANCAIENVNIVCGIDSCTSLAKITGDYSGFRQCSFYEGGTDGDVNGVSVVTIGAADGDADHSFVRDCDIYCPTTTGWAQGIYIAKDQNGVGITDNKIRGYFSVAPIYIPTAGNAQNDIVIAHNLLEPTYASTYGINIQGSATNTGFVGYNTVVSTSKAYTALCGGCTGLETNTWVPSTPYDEAPTTQRVAHVQFIPNDTGDTTLFNIRGGPILVQALYGRVTNAIKATSINLKLCVDPSDGSIAQSDLTATLDINAAAIGNTIKLSSIATPILVKDTAGWARHGTVVADPCDNGYPWIPNLEIYIPPGTIEANVDAAGDATDAIEWYLFYIPLSRDAWADPNN